jgi:hypothetical protein
VTGRNSLTSAAVADKHQQQEQPTPQYLPLLGGVPENGHPTREEGRRRGKDKRCGKRKEGLLSI